MNVPVNMTTPPMRLEDGEEIIQTQQGMRKKGWFGNRFGELHITNQRVVFIKAIMKAGVISAANDEIGAKPMLAFDHDAITGVQKVSWKKQQALVICAGERFERFIMDERGINAVLNEIPRAA